jgi:hypothetical protein
MRKLELEVYGNASNAAVVRAPGRRFPGVVVQGDTLATLLDSANEIVSRAALTSDDELAAEAEGLRDRLAGLVAQYEAVMVEHGLGLPYHRAR